MSIHSWFKRVRRSADAAAVKKAKTQWYETAGERVVTSGDLESIEADTAAARWVHEGSIRDADRLGHG